MTTAGSISVFLLAESRLLREALARILHKRSDINVVGSTSQTPAITETITSLAPQVLLYDPADIASGFTLIRTLREFIPSLRIVLIGMEAGADIFLRAVREGIAGYALKDA